MHFSILISRRSEGCIVCFPCAVEKEGRNAYVIVVDIGEKKEQNNNNYNGIPEREIEGGKTKKMMEVEAFGTPTEAISCHTHTHTHLFVDGTRYPTIRVAGAG